jgi:hypothetical protein
VKATQEGRWNRVKALQRLLTHSYSAKVLAVKRVTENEGKRTPGVDGEVWDTSQKKARAVRTVVSHHDADKSAMLAGRIYNSLRCLQAVFMCIC